MAHEHRIPETAGRVLLTDGSRLITEALARAGTDVFIGYPITPANLLYQYASKRFKSFLAAPDEITTLQWMCGFSAAGWLPVTATSFPGYALMLESVNMAYMMELPMVIILVQRLGPATGTATCGAQGDLLLVNGSISGGYTIPTLSISNSTDCWEMAHKAVETAIGLRSPVILLTSKEEVMTLLTCDTASLEPVVPVERPVYQGNAPYLPYQANESLVPDFVSLQSVLHQVRLTASTHDQAGILQNKTAGALANTSRLQRKVIRHLPTYFYYEHNRKPGADTLVLTYGITSRAVREAVKKLRDQGVGVDSLIVKTLLPVCDTIFQILDQYDRILIAEENLTGQYRQILFGAKCPAHVSGINKIGKMIRPKEIMEEVLNGKA